MDRLRRSSKRKSACRALQVVYKNASKGYGDWAVLLIQLDRACAFASVLITNGFAGTFLLAGCLKCWKQQYLLAFSGKKRVAPPCAQKSRRSNSVGIEPLRSCSWHIFRVTWSALSCSAITASNTHDRPPGPATALVPTEHRLEILAERSRRRG